MSIISGIKQTISGNLQFSLPEMRNFHSLKQAIICCPSSQGMSGTSPASTQLPESPTSVQDFSEKRVMMSVFCPSFRATTIDQVFVRPKDFRETRRRLPSSAFRRKRGARATCLVKAWAARQAGGLVCSLRGPRFSGDERTTFGEAPFSLKSRG